MTSRLLLLGLLQMLASARIDAQPVGPNGNLPLPPDEIVRRLRDEPFDITQHKRAGGGIMGAQHWHMNFADGQQLQAKWKAAPQGGEGWNSRPRLEIAAYAVQQFLFDPDDQVVPPTVARCVALTTLRVVDDDPTANLPETACVFGALCAWLNNVYPPDTILDRDRFARDRRFAEHLGNANLLTYLIAHRDGRTGNFLMSTDPSNPQIFSIDNGIAFGANLFNWFAPHFDKLRIAGLPRRAVQRLRAMSPADFERLGVLAQWERGADGLLRHVPATSNIDAEGGTRLAGPILQLGLTRGEIAQMAKRREHLLEMIDTGKVSQF